MRGLAVRTRLTMAHGLMLAAALVAFVATTRVLQDRQQRVEVVVASAPIKRGEPVSDGRSGLTTISIAADNILAGMLVQPGDVPSGHLVRDLHVGEPLLRTDVIIGVGGGGSRTLALPVDRSQIEGLGLSAGDVVDVIGVDSSGELALVAAGLRVAHLPSSTPPAAFGAVSGAGFVTVEVTTEQAIALVRALDAGTGVGREAVQLIRATGAPASDDAPNGGRP